MASVTMAAAFLGGIATGTRTGTHFVSFAPATSHSHRRNVVINSVKANPGKVSCENKKQEDISNANGNGRREMVFAAAAAALCTVAAGNRMAVAEEPKPGTPAAKKAYAPVCVSNPTAKICNN